MSTTIQEAYFGLDIIGSRENRWVKIKFSLENGDDKLCHYCNKIGKEKLVTVHEIKKGEKSITVDTEFFKEAKVKFKELMLHGRSVCDETSCKTYLAVQRELKKGPPPECED